MRAEQQRINTLTDDDEKQKARDALNRGGNEVLLDTSRRHLLRALYSTAQLREQMTWFWMNHFSVSLRQRLDTLGAGRLRRQGLTPACAGQVPATR
ncbi:DUF1800 family protein [Cupriavidus basilensis]